ncbi:MAG: hypothetical protein AABY06_03760 [Nanoarchaeota archaeon]
MVNEEILGGLRHALNRGESLEKAMISFYNAGYRKDEIEETARFIQQEGIPISVAQETNFSTNLPKRGQLEETKLLPALINSQSKISSYGQEKSKLNPIKKAGKGLLIAVIIITIIFVGLLIAFLVVG